MTAQSYYDEEVIFAGVDNTYWQAYGLSCDPFSINEDSIDAISSWEDHLDLLFHLSQYNNLLLAIVGESDSGKTTLLNHFQHKVESLQRVISLNATAHLDPIELLALISSKLGLDWEDHSETSLSEKITSLVYSIREEQQQAILLINQAHLLPEKTVQALFEIVEMQQAEDKALGVVIAGEDSLGSMLNGVMDDHDRELTHIFNLKPLSFEETKKYLYFCLQAAGFDGPVPLTERQLKQIHQASEGYLGRVKQETKRVMIAESEKMQGGDSFVARNYLALVSAMMILITSCIYVIGLLHDTEEPTTRFVQAPLPHKSSGLVRQAGSSDVEPTVLSELTRPALQTKQHKQALRLANIELGNTKSDVGLQLQTDKKQKDAVKVQPSQTAVVKQPKPAEPTANTAAPKTNHSQPLAKQKSPSVEKATADLSHAQKPVANKAKAQPVQTSQQVQRSPAHKTRRTAPLSQHHGDINQTHHTLHQIHHAQTSTVMPLKQPSSQPAAVKTVKAMPAKKVHANKPVVVKTPQAVSSAEPVKPAKSDVQTMRRQAQQRAAQANVQRVRHPSIHPQSAFADEDLRHLARSLDPDELDSYTDKNDFDTDYDEDSQFREIKSVKGRYHPRMKMQQAEPKAHQSPSPTRFTKDKHGKPVSAFKERDITIKPTRVASTKPIAKATQIAAQPQRASKVKPMAAKYTLQLAAVVDKSAAEAFLRKNHLTKKASYYKTVRRGKPMYVVVYGRYPSSQSAKQAIMTLPKSVQRMKPWPHLQQG